MIPYYTLMAFLMFDDLEESHEALDENMDARLETHGFWVLGITYTIMGILSFPLLFAGLLNISWLCVAFLVLQIPPVLVNCYYLLVAIMYGIELETFITYGVPQALFREVGEDMDMDVDVDVDADSDLDREYEHVDEDEDEDEEASSYLAGWRRHLTQNFPCFCFWFSCPTRTLISTQECVCSGSAVWWLLRAQVQVQAKVIMIRKCNRVEFASDDSRRGISEWEWVSGAIIWDLGAYKMPFTSTVVAGLWRGLSSESHPSAGSRTPPRTQQSAKKTIPNDDDDDDGWDDDDADDLNSPFHALEAQPPFTFSPNLNGHI
ncbi:GL11715 [Drosophila persimilis]|uniref:GL11715 n=1 Tax=Drosophila persimilis TaxID=7234 RepID=B4GD86_DROPE|nr:GL11715 [Drosophila persimilis]